MARGGDAHSPAIHQFGATTHNGHVRAEVDADKRLGHRRARRIQRVYSDHSMDSPLSNYKFIGSQVQERIEDAKIIIIHYLLVKHRSYTS